MHEKWREVPGYPGYLVSSMGRCSGPRKKILKQSPNQKGYLLISMWNNGKRLTRAVHTIVAEAFIGPKPDGLECCHWNGKNQDNRRANLGYVTHKENQSHRILHGTNGRKLTEGNVRFILENHKPYDSEFSTRALGRKFGVAEQTIYRIVRGTTWKHIVRPTL